MPTIFLISFLRLLETLMPREATLANKYRLRSILLYLSQNEQTNENIFNQTFHSPIIKFKLDLIFF